MTLEAAGTIMAMLFGVANFIYLVMKDKGKEIWRISDRLNKLDHSRSDFRDSILTQVDTKYDESVNRFGETMKAQAEHVRLLELELYKNFVRIDTFKDSLAMLAAAMNERLNRLDKRFDVIEELLRSRT